MLRIAMFQCSLGVLDGVGVSGVPITMQHIAMFQCSPGVFDGFSVL